MKAIFRIGILATTSALAIAALASPAFSQNAGAPPAVPAPQLRDGQHDLDFNLGTWKTHIRRLKDPLTGSNTWTEMEGTVTFQKIWDGKAQLETIEASGPGANFEGMQIFLYNPEAHQWSMTFANSRQGVLTVPAVGEFKDGRLELYDQEPYNGRMILVRAKFFDISPDTHRFEQAFSDDGGKTWEPNFTATLTRVKS